MSLTIDNTKHRGQLQVLNADACVEVIEASMMQVLSKQEVTEV